jgi:hypothetical protein
MKQTLGSAIFPIGFFIPDDQAEEPARGRDRPDGGSKILSLKLSPVCSGSGADLNGNTYYYQANS